MPPRRTLNRRDFLRMAGVVGASVATAHRLHAAPALAQNRPTAGNGSSRPWWVRTVAEPTVAVDWDRLQRFDARDAVSYSRGPGRYLPAEEWERLKAAAAQNEARRLLDAAPGYTLKDQALLGAQQSEARQERSFLGPGRARTPAERGVPPWQGSPDEAAAMLRAAMRHFGAATVGFVELNERTRKLIYSHDPDGKALVFEEVAQAYETADTRVIPNAAKWAIVFTVQMSNETLRRAPTVTASQTTMAAYGRGLHVQNLTQEFLRGLGYQGLGEAVTNGLGVGPALAVMAGLGEMSRANRLITPEFGPMVRIFKLITDLPVKPDQPIDAGIVEFCKRCCKCAEACPAGALSHKVEPDYAVVGGWNNAGHQAFFEDAVKCLTYMYEHAGSDCGICLAVCPFSKQSKAWIHRWVKTGISMAPSADSALRSLDDAFSYGARKDSAEWWRLDLPEYGIDTASTVLDE